MVKQPPTIHQTDTKRYLTRESLLSSQNKLCNAVETNRKISIQFYNFVDLQRGIERRIYWTSIRELDGIIVALYFPKTSVIALPVVQARIVLRRARITARDFNRLRLLIRQKTGYAENGSHARHVANATAAIMAVTKPKNGKESFPILPNVFKTSFKTSKKRALRPLLLLQKENN